MENLMKLIKEIQDVCIFKMEQEKNESRMKQIETVRLKKMPKIHAFRKERKIKQAKKEFQKSWLRN